ncbi:MAG TPA: hypothetical protein VFQ61_05310 [Polyangiaceae bacterium]|nr:hypothetical protein [Polyangiaceae bacterium]
MGGAAGPGSGGTPTTGGNGGGGFGTVDAKGGASGSVGATGGASGAAMGGSGNAGGASAGMSSGGQAAAGAGTGGFAAGAAGAGGSGAGGNSAGGNGSGGSSAGATNTGGGSGSGGSSVGAGGSGDSGGSSGGASGSAILTEGFEGTALPSGWDNFIGYVKNGMNPQGEFKIVIDSSKKHSGSSSVHFHGGSTPAMLTRPLPANTKKLYVRVWVWLSRSLGNNPDGNHETLLGIRKNSGTADNEVRFGEIKGAIGVNEVPTDALSLKPELWNKGPTIAKEKWVCLEAAFLGDKATHEFYAWADGMEVHKIIGASQWHAPVAADFLTGKFNEFIIGWQSFSNFTADVWADDLVLSTERVGCN